MHILFPALLRFSDVGLLLLRLIVAAALLVAANAPAQQPAPQPAFTFQEVMIPVRDGVHLQTAILTPTDKTGPLPILFRRTPYGVPDGPLATVPTSLRELARDGYIFVFQNLRGRFKSEGVFGLTSQVNLADSTSTNETTDAYDSIDWLVKHVPNNGNVGMFGVSYDGLTTALALLHPHPALKAISEQAARSEEHTSELQSPVHLVCRLLLEKKKKIDNIERAKL